MEATNHALKQTVEQFLFREAKLIDERQLDKWCELFAEDGSYCVPGAGEKGEEGWDGFVINENRKGIEFRALRLLHQSAHTQVPPMRTVHAVTNVLLEELDGNELDASCVVVVHWSRGPRSGHYAGSTKYRLRLSGDETIQIVKKTVWLVNRDQPIDRMPVL